MHELQGVIRKLHEAGRACGINIGSLNLLTTEVRDEGSAINL